jgi:hypothetical protein
MKAFPQRVSNEYQVEHGMDLRDYFAGQAMLVVKSSDYASTAECCYKLADAMMKAREQ